MEPSTRARRSPRPRPGRTRARNALGLAAVPLVLGGALAACGDDDPDEALPIVDGVDSLDESPLFPQLGGLELTVTGNVSEIIDSQAFQIDKDGLGQDPSATGDSVVDPGVEVEDDYFGDDYDVYDFYDGGYDFYDFEYYTSFDAEIDEFDEQGVLVVTPGGSQVVIGDAVQVNGTLRHFDEVALETIYDVDFDDELYEDFDSQYVIIADAVKSVSSSGAQDAGSTTSTTADGGDATTSTTTEDGDDATTTSTTAEE